MPGEDLHLSMLVRSQAHLNRCAVGSRPAFGTLSIAAAFSLTSDYQFATPPFLSEICYEYNPL